MILRRTRNTVFVTILYNIKGCTDYYCTAFVFFGVKKIFDLLPFIFFNNVGFADFVVQIHTEMHLSKFFFPIIICQRDVI